MTDRYQEMNDWSSEQIAQFKEAALQADQGEVALPGIEAARGPRLVAEGDSWFDYLPGTDLIDCLRSHHQRRIRNFAKAGDTLENMIYGTGINRRFERTSPQIERVLDRLKQDKPPVFLFSGGGNDVAGEEFEGYLNHRQSGLDALREDFAQHIIHDVFRKYFEDLIKRVAAVSPETHIVTHGYGHTAPTGEGVDFLFFTFAGPWLRPALAMKGIFDRAEQRATVFKLIDLYNEMLAGVAQRVDKFHHVDLRPVLNPDSDWANELHPKNGAFARAAERINAQIEDILSN